MSLILPFTLLALLAAGLAALALRGGSGPAARLLAVVLACLVMPVAYGALIELLGRPKPVGLEWRRPDPAEALVLGSLVREGRSIHLWLQLPDEAEPLALALPWSRPLAEQLQEAERQARGTGSRLLMRRPLAASRDRLPAPFYPAPQPARPAKIAAG